MTRNSTLWEISPRCCGSGPRRCSPSANRRRTGWKKRARNILDDCAASPEGNDTCGDGRLGCPYYTGARESSTELVISFRSPRAEFLPFANDPARGKCSAQKQIEAGEFQGGFRDCFAP